MTNKFLYYTYSRPTGNAPRWLQPLIKLHHHPGVPLLIAGLSVVVVGLGILGWTKIRAFRSFSVIVAVLGAALVFATTDLVSAYTPATSAEIHAVQNRLVTHLGHVYSNEVVIQIPTASALLQVNAPPNTKAPARPQNQREAQILATAIATHLTAYEQHQWQPTVPTNCF